MHLLPALLVASSGPVTLSASGLLAADVPGAQPVDLLYIGGVVAVLGFGGRQVFDSAFAENTNEYRPPLPFFGGRSTSAADPAEMAESLRQRLQEAAEAGDLETAFRLEKELKQLLAESGVRYVVEKDGDRKDGLPENW